MKIHGVLLLTGLLLVAVGARSQVVRQPGEESRPETVPADENRSPGRQTGSETAPKEGGEAQQDSAQAEDPFDYQSSEQISEDLSVSFPVDI